MKPMTSPKRLATLSRFNRRKIFSHLVKSNEFNRRSAALNASVLRDMQHRQDAEEKEEEEEEEEEATNKRKRETERIWKK